MQPHPIYQRSSFIVSVNEAIICKRCIYVTYVSTANMDSCGIHITIATRYTSTHFLTPLSTNYEGQSGRDMKLTTHLHLVPRSRMVELYFHSPMSSWHSAWLSTGTLPFTYYELFPTVKYKLLVGFEVHTVLPPEMYRRVGWWKSTGVSVKHIASIFRAEVHPVRFLAWLTLQPWGRRRCVPPKSQVAFHRTTRRYIPKDISLHKIGCTKMSLTTWVPTVSLLKV
jgi:hypothetical protein